MLTGNGGQHGWESLIRLTFASGFRRTCGHRERSVAAGRGAAVRRQCKLCSQAGGPSIADGIGGAGPAGSPARRRQAGAVSDGSDRMGRCRAGYHDAGAGGQIENREGCDGASGLVVPGASEGGPVLQKKHCWPGRPSARTCVRRVRSGRRTVSRTCVIRLTAWSSSTKPARRRR